MATYKSVMLIDDNEIDNIIMVGGSTRVPLVKKSVADFFGKEVDDQLNPDEVVALSPAYDVNFLPPKRAADVMGLK